MEERYEYLLDRYFSRKLSPDEKREMDTLLTKDPVFADVFGFQQKVAAAVISNERAQLKAILQKEESKPSGGSGWTIWTKTLLAVAAAIVVIAVAMPALTPYFQGKTGTETAIAFTRYPNEFASAGDNTSDDLLQRASNAYQAGNYPEAAALFGQITPPNPAYSFYQAVSWVGAANYTLAIPALESIANANNPDYSAPARYYLALSHYLSGNAAAAKTAAAQYLQTTPRPGDEKMRSAAQQMAQ